MKEILINGNFLCRNLTGIERFAWETCKRLDEIVNSNCKISILIPANAKIVPLYKNIKMIKSQKEIHGFPFWDLIEFRSVCKKNKAIGLNFSNTAPLGKYCGIAFIHDIYAADFPQDFNSFKDRLIRAYCKINYKNISKNAKMVLTVSHFSKERIQKKYNVPENRIEVIVNGWEHFSDISEDDTIFNRFPELLKNQFYFTLGSLSKRKNLSWIASYAQNHRDEYFAVSGKAISGLVPLELEALKKLENVILVGYVSDAQVKALMKKAKAFVFPSYYEGFGIPPLEALSVGTPIIVSKSACLPEIYGNSAHYIDAFDANCELSDILKQDIQDSQSILKTYTYKNAATKLYNIIQKIRNDCI